jgi:hypothetical protein
LFGVVGVICIMTPIVIFLIVNFPVIFNSPKAGKKIRSIYSPWSLPDFISQ